MTRFLIDVHVLQALFILLYLVLQAADWMQFHLCYPNGICRTSTEAVTATDAVMAINPDEGPFLRQTSFHILHCSSFLVGEQSCHPSDAIPGGGFYTPVAMDTFVLIDFIFKLAPIAALCTYFGGFYGKSLLNFIRGESVGWRCHCLVWLADQVMVA